LFCNYKCSIFVMKFEWDPRKATSNRDKHGIRFAEAGQVFLDQRRI
jgi:uncharacterized DUF497 family protein